MDNTLFLEDSCILICPKCHMLAIDPKICFSCGAEIPPSTKIKILNQNNKIYEVTGYHLNNFSESTFAYLNKTLSQEFTSNVENYYSSNIESGLKRIHDENCACVKYLKTEEEVKKSYLKAFEDEAVEENINQEFELASEELECPAEENASEEHVCYEENGDKEFKPASQELECAAKDNAMEEHNSSSSASSSSVHPAIGKFTINDDDIACLAAGEELNDSIIDFYLNYICYEMIPVEYQERTHIFSSFFYPFLCTAFSKKSTSKKQPDIQKSVNSWIKNVDIFSKDFVFLPVNRNKHWYLVVICFLTQLNKNPSEEVTPKTSPTVETESEESSNMKNHNINFLNPRMKGKPCICFFDSFDKSSTVNKDKKVVAHLLKLFCKMLWNKKNPSEPYEWENLLCFKAVCPQQDNDVDCGLFLLQYFESFFKNPIPYFGKSMPILKNWFPKSIMKGKRDQIKKVISELKERQLKTVRPESSCGSDVIVLSP